MRKEIIGDAELWLGDCREILPTLTPCGFVCITDPPYGINHSSSHGASWQNTSIAGDSDTSLRDEVLEHFANVAAFGTWKTPPIRDTRGVLVWNKGPASGMGDLSFPWKLSWELIYIRGKEWRGRRDEGVLSGPSVLTWESCGREHQHEKPAWIAGRIISKARFAECVIDPFMGTGFVGVACARKMRKFIGVEIEQHWFDVACRRIEAETRQGKLFTAPEPKPEQLDLIGKEAVCTASSLGPS